jgi:hypothetical protein
MGVTCGDIVVLLVLRDLREASRIDTGIITGML